VNASSAAPVNEAGSPSNMAVELVRAFKLVKDHRTSTNLRKSLCNLLSMAAANSSLIGTIPITCIPYVKAIVSRGTQWQDALDTEARSRLSSYGGQPKVLQVLLDLKGCCQGDIVGQ
jgi:hypothetical protein